jgi:hypothetical protein
MVVLYDEQLCPRLDRRAVVGAATAVGWVVTLKIARIGFRANGSRCSAPG